MFQKGSRCPELVVMNRGEDSVRAALSLTRAESRVVVRITGGCALNPRYHGELPELFVSAFRGFEGGIIFGGTRTLSRSDGSILPSVTEAGPLIGKECPKARVLGIVPRVDPLLMVPEYGLIVTDDEENDHLTIIHPEQDTCLLVQKSCDREALWEDERIVAEAIVADLMQVNWQSLLIAYNGGDTTRNEIRRWAALGWPVILIKGSGRVTGRFSRDEAFLERHPNVTVVERGSASLRAALVELAIIAAY